MSKFDNSTYKDFSTYIKTTFVFMYNFQKKVISPYTHVEQHPSSSAYPQSVDRYETHGVSR